jgi:hypothetical protein
VFGGLIAIHCGEAYDVAISAQTKESLTKLGIHDFCGLAPRELFEWKALLTLCGFV